MTAASFSRVLRPLQASYLVRTWVNRRDLVLRFLDVILAVLALVVLAPIMAVIAATHLADESRHGDLPANEGRLSTAELSDA